VGLTRKSRQFWVHAEGLEMHNVGTVQVLYSTMKPVVSGRAVEVQKVLLTSERERGLEEIIALYDLRWQIELFVEECKQVLGLARYRFSAFACVKSWVSQCLLCFIYLGWYRQEMLRESGRNPGEQRRWRWQRSHGLCLGGRQDLEEQELEALHQRVQTPSGVAELRELLRRAVQKEYRKSA
jgi:hypothetical protein